MKKLKVRIFYILILVIFIAGSVFVYKNYQALATNLTFTDDFSSDTYKDSAETYGVVWDTVGQEITLDTYDGYTSTDQSNYDVTSDIKKMSFIDASTGWAVGENEWYEQSGVLLYTDDGGSTWSRKNNFTGGCVDVQFFDANTGYVATGSLHKTTDGGDTFQEIDTSTWPGGSKGMYFLDANHGWVVGIDGMIVYTADGGDSWTVQKSDPTIGHFFDIYAIDANNAWAVSEFGYIYYYNGGTWTQQLGPGNQLLSVYFLNASTGWVVGDGVALYTTNGGTTWNAGAGIVGTASDVMFVDANIGYAPSATPGTYYKTINGGLNWSSGSINQSVATYSIYAHDANNVFIGGDFGAIEKTSNGGTNWTTQITASAYDGSFYDLDMRSDTLGYAITNTGYVVKTTDGANWSLVGNMTCGYTCRTLDFYSDTEGVVAGDSGYIYKTTDSGANWTQKAIGLTSESLTSVSFLDTSNGLIVGTNGDILKTTDAGENWSAVDYGSESRYGVDYVTASIAYAVGLNGDIIKSNNGGTTWNDLTSGVSLPFYAVDFIDQNNGWVAGESTILKTNDGGATWTVYNDTYLGLTGYENFVDIYVKDNNNVWAVSDRGNILRTYNGGRSWVFENASGTFDLNFAIRSVAFSPVSNEVWVGTADSRIYNFDVVGSLYQPASVAQSLTIDTTPIADIHHAYISADETLNGETISYYLSNDGGSTWVEAQNNKKAVFSSIGSDLRWKVVLYSSTGASTPILNSPLSVYYTANQRPNQPEQEMVVCPPGGCPPPANPLLPIFRVRGDDPDGDLLKFAIEIATDSNFNDIIYRFNQLESQEGWLFKQWDSSNNFNLPARFELSAGTTYYWRIQSIDESLAYSQYSVTYQMTMPDMNSFTDKLGSDYYRNSTSSADWRTGPKQGVITLPAINSFNAPTSQFGIGETLHVIPFDADEDGDLDVAVRNMNQNYLYINDGGGSFTQNAEFGNYADSGGMAVFDADNDGDKDVLISLSTGTNQLYLNNGDGTFVAPINCCGSNGEAIIANDVDHDGDMDVLVGRKTQENSLYINNGAGTFTELSPNPFLGINDNSYAVDIADLDNNGWPDLIIGNYGEPSYWYLNNGKLGFVQQTLISTSPTLHSIEATDIDNDGDMDVVKSGSQPNILVNDGTGSFTVSNPGIASSGISISTADIDGDGDLDLLEGTLNGTNNSVYRNKGNGDFNSAENLFGTTNVNSIVASDVDNDGDLDVLLGNYQAGGQQNLLYSNSGAANFVKTSLAAGEAVLAVFDSDNDGDQDLYVSTGAINELWVNDGAQNYTKSAQFSSSAKTVLPLDVDNDGDLDIIEAVNGGVNQLYINNGSNSFTLQAGTFGSSVFDAYDVKALDVENDGDWDVIFANGSGDPQLWLNDGSGSFTVLNIFPGPDSVCRYFDVGDVDADGDVDVAFSEDSLFQRARLLLNDGAGNFTLKADEFPGAVNSIDFGDLDNDGDLDAVLTNSLEPGGVLPPGITELVDYNYIYTNDGYGNFQKAWHFTSQAASDATLIDIDNDHDLDIVFANEQVGVGSYNNILYRNNGNLNFVKEQWFFTDNDDSDKIVVGDYDWDGDMDLFTVNSTGTSYKFTQKQKFQTGTAYFCEGNSVDSTAEAIKKATISIDGYTPTSTLINYFLSSGDYNWDAKASGTVEDLQQMKFFGASDGVICGDSGTVLFTNDSGDSWADISPAGVTNNFYDFAGLSGIELVGSDGAVYYTPDGLAYTQKCVGLTTNDLNGISEVAGNYSYAVGDSGTIIQLDLSALPAVGCLLQTSGVVVNLNSAYGYDVNNIVAVGDSGTIIKTTDAGINWLPKTSGTTQNLYGINCSGSNCVAVGAAGTIVRSDDSGDTWTVVASPVTSAINKVVFTDADNLWAVADSDYILRSDNAGQTWTSQISSGAFNIRAVAARSDMSKAVVCGTAGKIYKQDEVKFDAVTAGSEHSFTSSSDLSWKVELISTDPNESPVIQGVNLSYSTQEDSGGSAVVETPAVIPEAPTPGIAVVGVDNIKWYFTDNSEAEIGFELRDSEDNVLVSQQQQNLYYLTEVDLTPNTLYAGRVVFAFSSAGYSSPALFADDYYTLAQIPAWQSAQGLNSSTVELTVAENNNPDYTKYAIYESTTQKWLQQDNTLGEQIVWQTLEQWGGENAIEVVDLQALTEYTFQIKARNQDLQETDLSEAISVTTMEFGVSNIIINKTVTIGLQTAGGLIINLGQPVCAASTVSDLLIQSSQWTNWLLIIILLTVLCAIFVLIRKCDQKIHKKIKYAPAIIFKDFSFRDPDKVYKLLNPEDTEKKYYFKYFRGYRTVGFLTLVLVILSLLKLVLFISLLLTPYSIQTSFALVNDDGQPVLNGNVLTYQINYENTGDADAQQVAIQDFIPENTVYKIGSLIINGQPQSDAKDDDLADVDQTLARAVNVQLPELVSGQGGYVQFQVTVDGEDGQEVSNQALAFFDDTRSSSNTTSNIIEDAEEPEEPEEIEEPQEPQEPEVPVVEPPVAGSDDGQTGPSGEEQGPEEPEEIEEAIEEEIEEEVKEPVEELPVGVEDQPVEEQKTVEKTVESITQAIGVIQAIVLDNPRVEEVNEIVKMPVVVTAGVASVVIAATVTASTSAGAAAGAGLLTYLQFFTTQPALFFGRRRRQSWGIVYDSVTKKPVPLAIIRIYSKKTNKLISTKVTDKNGRYQLVVEPGEYYIVVNKQDYKFPSEILFNKKQDTKYLDLYHGADIPVDQKSALNFNIPVDPNKKALPISQEIKRKTLLGVKHFLAWLTPILTLISFIIQPKLWVFAVLIGQLLLLLLFKKMAVPPKLKNWGVVRTLPGEKPTTKSVVRVFNKQYNKLLETQVTDSRGRYGFLVSPDTYYITAEKNKYDKYKSDDIEIRREVGGAIIRDVNLSPKQKKPQAMVI